MTTKKLVSLIALLGLLSSIVTAAPMGTAFTYQGRLTESGAPYTGNAEFQATLWDAASEGTALATNVTGSVIVGVTNGLFLLPLDFGTNFPGDARWLQLEVRTAIGPYATLAPRQPLTPAPYALYAPNAGVAATASSVPAANLTGTVADDRLSGNVALLNGNQSFTGVNTFANAGNSLTGNGSGLTALNANHLDSGTVSDARLSANIPRLNNHQTFSGDNTFSGGNNSFAGDGSGLTSLNAHHITSGTLPGSSLSGLYSAAVTFNNPLNSFTGNGSGLTSLNANNLSAGTVADIRLSPNVALLNASQTFTANNVFSSGNNSFSGSGAGLTSLNAGNLSSGTLPNARLAGTYSSAVTFNNVGNSYTGNGAGLTGVIPADNSVTSARIVDGTITSADIGDGQVANADLANNAVTSAKIADAAVLTAKLADGSVTSAKIVDATITSADLGDSQVATVDLANNAVTSAKIIDGTVASADLASDSASLQKVSGGNMNISGGFVGIGTSSPAEALTVNGNAYVTGNLGINTDPAAAALDVAGDMRVRNLIRSGIETRTSETPYPAGLVVRRINSVNSSSNQVVAVARNNGNTANITLERDGSLGGFLIRYPANPGHITIACMGMDSSGAQQNSYKALANPAAAGTMQIYTDAQNVVHFECTFGDTFDSGQHLTQVTLSRYANDNYWSGTVMSTYNQ